jgi:hypothetical protein
MAVPAQQAPDQIVEEVQTGNLPGIPARDVPPSPGESKEVRARLDQEYVTAGQWQFYLNYLRSLPYALDDVTRDFGDDLYDRMLHDAQIKKLDTDFRAGMLEDGLVLAPAIDDETPEGIQAREIATWCQWVLDHLDTPLDDVLWDMGAGVSRGSRVAELVWQTKPDMDGHLRLILTAIKTKPRHATAFVTDSFNNLVGLLGLVPGQPFLPQTGLIITDPSFLPNFLPREKFCVFSFRPENNDPRGTSLLRAAYDAWWVKQQVKVSYLKYLAQFASPSLIGYTPEGAEDQVTMDGDGNVTITLTPEQAMAASLATFQNGTVVVFPCGAKVDPLEIQGDGAAFMAAFQFENNEMAGAILGQTLASEEGKHQSRAATGHHQDIKDQIIRQAKGGMERMVARDIVTPLVRYNYGDQALRLLPKVSLGAIEQADFASMATGIAALETAGYLGESQKSGIDELLGLPPRDVAADAEAAQAALAAAVAAAAATAANQPGQRTIGKAAGGPEASGQRAVAQQAEQQGAA